MLLADVCFHLVLLIGADWRLAFDVDARCLRFAAAVSCCVWCVAVCRCWCLSCAVR